jgi:hypothetical protein
MRVFLGRPAEHIREPPDAFLVRHIHKVPIAEDIREAVRTIIRPAVRRLL